MGKEVFELSRGERKKIQNRCDREFDKRIFRRLSVLLALDDGYSQEEVGRLFGTTARNVRRWIKAYRQSGLDELCRIGHKGRSCFLSEEQLQSLHEQIEAGNFRSAKLRPPKIDGYRSGRFSRRNYRDVFGFKLFEGQVSKGLMNSLPVVKDFDVFEDA